MEYLLINRSTLQALCSSIGWTSEDGTYKLSFDCLKTLCTIEEQLRNENVTTRTIRLSLGLSRFVERDLLKILESIEIKEEIPIVRITLKILVNLTLPPEWLLTGENKLSSKGEGLSKRVRQLQKILLDSKKAFVKTPRATAAIIKAMRMVLTPSSPLCGDCDQEKVSTEKLFPSYLHTSPYSNRPCEHEQVDKHLIKDCLLIFRNLLYIPEKIEQGEDRSEAVKRNSSRSLAEDWQDTQQRVIWNLLVQGLDNSLLNLMNSCHRHYWTSYIVQVIALLYRDQPVNKMGHHILSRSCHSDNSEDDIDSDHTLSAQRSSSTSILSDSSSKESGSSLNKTSKNDSGFYLPTESDKTSSDGSFQSGQPHTGFVITEGVSDEDQKEWNQPMGEVLSHHDMSEDQRESCGNAGKGGMKQNDNHHRSETSLSIGYSSPNGEQNYFENQEESNNADGYIEGVLSNQTSGFSGSSEDDCSRKMHKVMKPHQRSNSPNESDSSDESDYLKDKMSNRGHHHVKKVSMSSKNKNSSGQSPSNAIILTQAIANSRGSSNSIPSPPLPPPIKKKPGCYPSICMDAAIAKALAALSTDNSRPSSGSASTSSTIIPGETRINFLWDKKHTCGSKGNSIGSESSAPSEGDIRFLLEEFTLKFLHNFFASQVCDLTKDSVNGKQGPSIDMSHTLWLLGYFLKISNILDLNLSHLRAILTSDSFGLLVFNGLLLNEELEQIAMIPNLQSTAQSWVAAGKEDSSSKHVSMKSSSQAETSSGNSLEDREETLRRLSRKLQLLITALKEMIITLSNYIDKPCLSEEERKYLDNLCISLSQMRDLRQFFLLLIRCYSPVIHPKSFLMDVILAHHHLLLLLDGPFKNGRFDLVSHLRQFSTIKVMEQYGQVLESFRNNPELMNDCVFTMMHHVAGDLGNPECLFQPTILKTFSLIMESELELIDSWEGMMEYVMNRFIKAASNATKPTPSVQINAHDEDLLSTRASTHDTRDATICSSRSYSSDLSSIEALSECSSLEHCGNDQEKDQLYWLFLQYEQTIDPISCILEALMEEQGVTMERKQLYNTLKTRGLINQTNELRFTENDEKSVQIVLNYHPDTSDNELNGEAHASYLSSTSIENLITHNDASEKLIGTDILIARLRTGYADQLTWISNLLVDICNMRMHRIKNTSSRDLSLQPLAYFSEIFGHSAPLVPFTEKQELAMNSKPMLELFRRLGFQLPNELGKLYLRVPTFFSPDIVFRVANKLSQVPPENLSFRIEEIMKTGPDLDSCCNSINSLT